MMSKQVTVQNKEGFHVRPAQMFVNTSNQFSSEIKIQVDDKEIDGKSILGLMTLGLGEGAELTIVANGDDEEAAVNALVALVESKFGEE